MMQQLHTLGEAAVTASKLSYEVVEVTVAHRIQELEEVTAGSIILGCYPKSNQDQFIDSVAVAETTVTVTLAAATEQRIQRSIAKGVIPIITLVGLKTHQ